MQSADDAELAEIGRVHTMAQVSAAVEAARKAKFENLSLDLIYGLPHQTLEGWQRTLWPPQWTWRRSTCPATG